MMNRGPSKQNREPQTDLCVCTYFIHEKEAMQRKDARKYQTFQEIG
jgi:hypothetical protein